MKQIGIIRLNSSPYFEQNFLFLEKNSLEKIQNIKYLTIDQSNLVKSFILITNTHTKIDKIPLNILNNTELIIHANSGYDNLVSNFEIIKNIPIIIGHEIRAQAVFDYILSAVVEATSPLPKHEKWDPSRKWPRKLLKDYNVALFGLGHIGQKVKSFFNTIGSNIVVIDPYKKNCFSNWEEIELEKFEIVISCMSLNSKNHFIFNSEFFSKAHPQLIFINSARGSLVDEKAFKSFFIKNTNAKAYLDVFENEPFHDEWKEFKNIFKTSHIAGVYKNLDEETIKFEYKIVKDFCEDISFKEKYKELLLQSKLNKGMIV